MKLFKEENFQVVIETEAKLIPEFKKIIVNDKDRKKRTAHKYLSFIYFMCDYRSPYSIYPETERKRRLLSDLKFTDDEPITTDIGKGMDKYNNLQRTPTISALKAIREGLLISSRVISALNEQIEIALNTVDGEEGKDVGSIMRDVKRLLEVSEQLPKAIDTINSLEEKVKKEQANETVIRGGGTKGLFED
jgi:hypothetical protein